MNSGRGTAQLHAPFKHVLLSNNPARSVCINPTGFLNLHLRWRPQCCTTAGHSPDPAGTAVFPTSKPPPVGKGSPDTRK